MRSSRQKASISKLDLDQFVFTPPGPMGWQAHDSISAEKEEEEKHLDVGSIRELPHINNAPKEYQKETKEKETDHKIVDDEEETKFETILEPEEERNSKRSAPPYEEEDEDEEPGLAEEARVEIIILPSESKPAPWFSQTVKRKA
ncbi:spore coat protein YtxO [Bacillus subtilis subsp. subtilis str. RO-NN-1]|uniref:hypothetical protein n=1 Tax=Bacillus subtilis TaxID=1423 RepID=UPI00022BB4E9|nr:hypothetical protein [Bacillus subtilis]AEP92090.1 spore coat protein YtxO [Bacillus subtilis subsp. subtilis str. RO-NN-1]UVZ57044.1 hypothetical protein NYR91_15195 [Bacillus subtilis]